MKNHKKRVKSIAMALSATAIAGTTAIGAVAQACSENTTPTPPTPPSPGSNDYVKNNVFEYGAWENSPTALLNIFEQTLLLTSASATAPYSWRGTNTTDNVVPLRQRWWLNDRGGVEPTVNFSVFNDINSALGIIPNAAGQSSDWTVSIDDTTNEATNNTLEMQIETGYTMFSATIGLMAMFDSILRDLYSVNASLVPDVDTNQIASRATRWVDLFQENTSYRNVLSGENNSTQIELVRNIVISGVVQVLYAMHYSTLGDLNVDVNSTALDLDQGRELNPYWYFFDYENLLDDSVMPATYNGNANMWAFLAEFLPNYLFSDPSAPVLQTTNTAAPFSTLLEAINNEIPVGGEAPFIFSTNPSSGMLQSPHEVFTESNTATPSGAISLTENYYYRNLALMFNGTGIHEVSPSLPITDVGSRIEYLRDLPATKSGNIAINVNVTSSTIDGDLEAETTISPNGVDITYSEFQLERYITAINVERIPVYYPVVSGFYMNSFLNPINVLDPFNRTANGTLIPTDYVILSNPATANTPPPSS